MKALTAAPELEVLEGLLWPPDRTAFPSAVVETLTEFGYDELPLELREGLELWTDAFREWIDTRSS